MKSRELKKLKKESNKLSSLPRRVAYEGDNNNNNNNHHYSYYYYSHGIETYRQTDRQMK